MTGNTLDCLFLAPTRFDSASKCSLTIIIIEIVIMYTNTHFGILKVGSWHIFGWSRSRSARERATPVIVNPRARVAVGPRRAQGGQGVARRAGRGWPPKMGQAPRKSPFSIATIRIDGKRHTLNKMRCAQYRHVLRPNTRATLTPHQYRRDESGEQSSYRDGAGGPQLPTKVAPGWTWARWRS